ncbi:MAG TPA: hypothetical protein VMZ03_04025 [Chitinophagaceae bacterium]|nr:hypothetical protein [Chitinophagaceae bacterium]
MNFTLTITASPELLSVLQGIIGLVPGKTATTKEKKQSTVMNLPDEQSSAGEENNSGTIERVTVEQIRAAVQGKGQAKRAEIKTLLTEFGATSVTALESSKYADFMEKLKAI